MARKRKSLGEMPDVGAAVVLTGPFDMFPHVWGPGERGTVAVSEEGRIEVCLDERYPELDAWDNCLVFYSEEAGLTHDEMLADFLSRVEVLPPAPAP